LTSVQPVRHSIEKRRADVAEAVTRNMPGGKMVEPPGGRRKQGDMPPGEMHEQLTETPATKRPAARTPAKKAAPKKAAASKPAAKKRGTT
jgi:hypothetical protein